MRLLSCSEQEIILINIGSQDLGSGLSDGYVDVIMLFVPHCQTRKA
jgi:hypothetical protein